MKSLERHMKESLEQRSIKIVYHFSYDIEKSNDHYNDRKSKLEEILQNTTPAFNKDICGSTKILGYADSTFNLFEVLENKLDENITYCLSVVSIKFSTNQFEVYDSEERLQLK